MSGRLAVAGRVPRGQRGVVLIALLAVIALGASWFLVSKLNAESANMTAAVRARNAAVLNRAKQALIGYIAAQAAKSGENRPGAFPCPEAPGNFNDSANEGTVAYPCTLPVVGRFPWRSLGLDKLVDAGGEPLWYAIASGWAGANTVVNSNCASYSAAGLACRGGRLSVDGVPVASSDVIALLIAPGPAITVSASANCAAWTQTRSTVAPPDWRNYLECQNATSPADNTFVTTGPSGSFNDQIVTITVGELMPALEAAIASRIEREIVPQLKAVYAAPGWGLSGADKLYPYPASFANPDISAFLGSSANTAGLLPLSYSETFPASGIACTAGASEPRCNPTLVSWSNAAPTLTSSGGITVSPTGCSYWGPTSWAECTGTYVGTPLFGAQITVSGPQGNGAMSLRQIRAGATAFVFWQDLTTFTLTWSTPSPTVVLNSNGTFTVSVTATPPAPVLPLVGVQYWIYVPGNATADHPLLDTRTAGASTSWFARNEWHKLAYYAIAPGYAASGAAPRSCATGSSCLSVANVTPAGGQRSILILAGRSINGSARPSTTLGDYLDFGNATGSYEKQPVSTAIAAAQKKPFNDRVVVVDSN